MHILFLTDNFPPEGNAPATRTYEHAVRWIKEGHAVTVITGAPNFPEGRVFPGYKNKWYQKEQLGNITVVRVKTYISPNEGFFKRILDYLSFMVTGFIAGFFQKKPDVIVATSPQFFNAVGGWALAALRRKPFVFELRDLWPASITAVGAMKHSPIIKLLEKLELFLYKKADRIICVTYSFKTELVARGVNEEKIDVVLNGVDLDIYSPSSSKDYELAQEFTLPGKFIVGYVGTLGLAHGLEFILQAAALLKHRSDICFVIAGSGAEKAKLEAYVNDANLENIVFIPRQPKERMKQLWSLCDISLVVLRDEPLFSSVIPSKIFESMGMGIPIIMSVPEGEATQIIEDTGSGIVVPPADPEALACAIEMLHENREELSAIALNSRKAAHNYCRATMAQQMLRSFDKAVS